MADEPQENMGFKEVRWMWECRRGLWVFYDNSETQQIEEAFLRDDATVSIQNVNGNFVIDFKSRTQFGQMTRKVQRVAIL